MKNSSYKTFSLRHIAPAARVALLYIIVAGLWILLSDRVLESFIKDPSALTVGQTIKGWLFVITMAIILYIERSHADQANREKDELEAQKYRLFDLAPTPMIVFDFETLKILAVNHASIELYGYLREEFAAMDVISLRPPEDEHLFVEALARVVPNSVQSTISRHQRKDGTLIDVEVTGLQITWLGRPARLASVKDITEKRRAERSLIQLNTQLEQRVTDRTSALLAKNKELETFAYSVSHDLKAPLRGIDGYSHLLLAEYAAQLDENGQQYLNNIRQATAQMNQLIEDLLAYSRLERRDLEVTSLEIRSLVERVLAERADDLDQRGIQVTVEVPNVHVNADVESLSQALRNLVDNAIKFTRDVPAAAISIGAQTASEKCLIWVSDNGPGFDMKYQERIFEIFQRLQRSEDFPGTGVGLAIVRKSMERLGGRAWAESTPGRGATFYLELPRAD